MTNRGLVLLGIGLALLGAGLLALNFPVYLDAFDKYGWQINCGTGYSSNLAQAQGANLASQCESALAMRRAWTIPLAALGGIILTGICIALYHHAAPRHEADVAAEDTRSRQR